LKREALSERRHPFRDRDDFPAILAATTATARQFLESLPDRPVAAPLPALAVAPLPENGSGALAALEHFRARFEAGMSGSAGPRYLGFVTGGTTPAALVGDWLTTVYDQNLSNAGDSLGTQVEYETCARLRELFGLPDSFAGVFVSGATMANATCLATARQWAGAQLGIDVAEDGLSGHDLPLLGGAPHASIYKAAAILGLGRRAVESVGLLPGRAAIDPEALARRLAAHGDRPAIVVASAGEVNTGDFDDLERLAELCQRHRAWLHVDGAFGLFAALLPEGPTWLKGLENADSIATDGHKWLNVPYDAGIVFTRHLEHQIAVFRAVAAYLGAGPDLLHRTPENSRRFRALPAWFALEAYGRDGFRELVERNCQAARALGAWLEGDTRFELLAPVRLNIVCFALSHGAAPERDAFLRTLATDGRVFMTPTVHQGRPGVRAAFSNWSTEMADVEIICAALGHCIPT
jgi:glutamate/tyrosine decarboxylase-like PLP-dependent enzyme